METEGGFMKYTIEVDFGSEVERSGSLNERELGNAVEALRERVRQVVNEFIRRDLRAGGEVGVLNVTITPED